MVAHLVVEQSAEGAGWWLRPLTETGDPDGPAEHTDDLPATVADHEARTSPRWVWEDTLARYPQLLAAGVRVARCHDLALTELLLRAHVGAWEPRVPPEAPRLATEAQGTLFEDPTDDARAGQPDAPARSHGSGPLPGSEILGPSTDLADRFTDQLRRCAVAARTSAGFGLLVASESAAALAAVEMGQFGLPWRPELHDAILERLLGPRPRAGLRPPQLQRLAEELAALLGTSGLNPDSPQELLRALHRAGILVRTTRRHELHAVDHPAIPLLLRYKALSRIHVAHGWAWREQWVQGGRFHPEYVPGGVVSGRWATRGGGALQIPRAVRGAVVADPGWSLVIADAGQLEPRVLAALSGDPGMVAATRTGDLYATLATRALGRADARAEAKVALLAAMYGGGTGSVALAAMRRNFPAALALLETAARAGEQGGLVRSVLGRTCPPPSPGWPGTADVAALRQGGPGDAPSDPSGAPPRSPAAEETRRRARGRFTRNFVVQASAADWANVLVASLRRRLAELSTARDGEEARQPELVFFQHDEVLVHTPAELADAVVRAVHDAGAEATRLVLGDCGVTVPLDAVVVASYAEKGAPMPSSDRTPEGPGPAASADQPVKSEARTTVMPSAAIVEESFTRTPPSASDTASAACASSDFA